MVVFGTDGSRRPSAGSQTAAAFLSFIFLKQANKAREHTSFKLYVIILDRYYTFILWLIVVSDVNPRNINAHNVTAVMAFMIQNVKILTFILTHYISACEEKMAIFAAVSCS